MIIATVRGFLLNFGVYHATRAALGLPFVVRCDPCDGPHLHLCRPD